MCSEVESKAEHTEQIASSALPAQGVGVGVLDEDEVDVELVNELSEAVEVELAIEEETLVLVSPRHALFVTAKCGHLL